MENNDDRYRRLISCMGPFTPEQSEVYHQVHAAAVELWKVLNTWGVTYEDLIDFGYRKGCLEYPEEDLRYRDPYLPGDVVYFHPVSGSGMTRSMAFEWFTQWHPFLSGYTQGYYAAATRKENDGR